MKAIRFSFKAHNILKNFDVLNYNNIYHILPTSNDNYTPNHNKFFYYPSISLKNAKNCGFYLNESSMMFVNNQRKLTRTRELSIIFDDKIDKIENR